MKRFRARNCSLLMIVLAAFSASGCGAVNGIRAKSALNDGARAYKAGDFAAAEEHFRRAVELDPDQTNAPMFHAKSIERQYKPTGVDTPENDAKAQQALAAYREILQRNPDNDEAYNSIARLLGYTKQTDAQRQFVTQRANDDRAPNEKRSAAFTFLASKQWRCSYDITEQTTSKQTVQKEGKTVIEYKKPANEEEFRRAQQCSDESLAFAQRAVSLNPNSEVAYSFVANSLLEKAKLAQMDGNAEAKANFERLADEARQKNAELSEQNQKLKDEEERQKREREASS